MALTLREQLEQAQATLVEVKKAKRINWRRPRHSWGIESNKVALAKWEHDLLIEIERLEIAMALIEGRADEGDPYPNG